MALSNGSAMFVTVGKFGEIIGSGERIVDLENNPGTTNHQDMTLESRNAVGAHPNLEALIGNETLARAAGDQNLQNQIFANTAIATTSTNGLMASADKTKLDGIAANANNYIHPTNHPASIITQDANNRFVTDALIAAWNGKANAAHSHAQADIDSAAGWISTALAGKQAAGSYLTTTSIELINASGVMQYRFTTSGTDCLIANAAGTTIGKIDQSGNLLMKGGIACYATI